MSKYAPHKRSANQPRATSSTTCQKCLQKGHFTYECKYERPYISRPSRTQQLENPRLLAKLKADGKPSVEVPEEFKNKTGVADKILEAKEKERSKDTKTTESARKRHRSASTTSRSDAESDSGSDSDSDSESSTSTSSDSDSSESQSSNSRSRDRKRSRRRSPSSESDRPSRKR